MRGDIRIGEYRLSAESLEAFGVEFENGEEVRMVRRRRGVVLGGHMKDMTEEVVRRER